MTNSKQVAVSVKDIHKEFILPQSKNTSFKQSFVNIVKRKGKVTQKVLDGVSFDVYKGDFFGIVGRNGSGKSTLLKLLAGVYVPTAGGVQINGKLTPFIELGVGFNPELSGRDNVYLNGALLGFDRKQMDVMYDEIVEFAELQPFMDQKLKNYSSGMQVRLAFSIAIKAKNEVLVFDEVLAVGDEAFQRKCLDVFEQYKAEGQTVILVTHDMETVRRFCTRAVLIHDGEKLMYGDPKKIAAKYSELNQEAIDSESLKKNSQKPTSMPTLTTYNADGMKSVSFDAGETILTNIDLSKLDNVTHVVLNIYKLSGEHITGFRYANKKGDTSIWMSIKPNIMPGRYHFVLQFVTKGDTSAGEEYQVAEFNVRNQYIKGIDEWSGLVHVRHEIVNAPKLK